MTGQLEHSITITFDERTLGNCQDTYLAMLWHVAQANPVPHGDKKAGELAERIGREIIRRWLAKAGAEMWHHQGRDHYWSELCRLAVFQDGEWVPREAAEPDEQATNVADLHARGRDILDQAQRARAERTDA